MSGMMLCSAAAKKPYYLKDMDINIYSIEELAYFLYHHLYLVDEEFFSEDLIVYLEEELHQDLVAKGIRQAKTHGGGLTEMISFVVKAASYFDAEELSKFQKELDILGSKSSLERLKAKGDILLSCKKYNSALECYKYIMMKRRDPALQPHFYGSVYNNMGVISARMFKYKNAASLFRSAYKISRDLLMLRHIVMSDMLGGEKEILAKDIDKFHIPEKIVEECKSRINAARLAAKEETPKDAVQPQINGIIHTYKSDI